MSKLILPHDITAESGVIASLIVNPELCLTYDMLKPNHFFSQEYSAMYWAITDLYRSGIENIDKYNLVVKISEMKSTQKMIDKVGGDSFIDMQLENAPNIYRDTEEEYKTIARKVVECAFRRETYGDIKKFEKKILDVENNLNELNGEIITTLNSSAERFISNEDAKLYSEKVDAILEKAEQKRKENSNGMIGIEPAWKQLSEYVLYERTELYVTAARMKSGKSIWLETEAIHKAKQGYKVFFSDSEMSDEKFTFRLLAMISGIPIDDIKAGRISNHNQQKYLDAIHFIKHAELHHEYNPQWTKENLLMKTKIVKNKFRGLDFIIHDYIKSTSVSSASEKSSELGDMTNFIKNHICGDMNLIGLSAVQMNRSNEIANSDEIARYVSYIFGFAKKTREEIMDHGNECGNRKLWIPVGRDGGELDYEDAIDMYINEDKATTNLRLLIANEQHVNQQPAFMMDNN